MKGKQMFDPTFQKYPSPSPYDLHHIPTPPPPPVHEPMWKRLAWVLLFTLLIAALGILVIWRELALGLFPMTSAPSAAILLLWCTTRVGIRRKRR
jgi:hypothetical protein